MSPLFIAGHFSAEAKEGRTRVSVLPMSSKAAHSCILDSRSVSIREEGPAVPLMHKFISVLLPSSGQMDCGVWWKWGKLSALGAVHFSPRNVVFVLYRRAA